MVGALQRSSPSEGHLAAFALNPELQAAELSELDPPKSRAAKTRTKGDTRPDRPSRTKRVRPSS
jgi:hypothetical protein